VTGPHARPMFDEIMRGVAPAGNIESEKGFVSGIPGMWVRPQSGPGDCAILYFHGGAYVVGSPRAYVNFVGQMVSRSGIPAFVADYALAPERPFPAAIEDALRAYNGLVEQGSNRSHWLAIQQAAAWPWRCFRRSGMPTQRRTWSSPYRPGPILRSRAHPC
jgi:epsilon-lactone hydrolase